MNMRHRLMVVLTGLFVTLSGVPVAGAEEIAGEGQVKAVDAPKRTVNLAHGPIATLGWPAMTMDFAMAPEVDPNGLRPGQKIRFHLTKTPDGQYRISKITPLP
ncbi:MAG: copper-binding protein [Magnetococcales bacterium]|nr:copper-binding protein [Magnetococcales bacterium]